MQKTVDVKDHHVIMSLSNDEGNKFMTANANTNATPVYDAAFITSELVRMKDAQRERLDMIRWAEQTGNLTTIELFQNELQHFGNLIVDLETRHLNMN